MSLLLLFMPGDGGGGGGDENCRDTGGRVQCRKYVCERRGAYNGKPLYVPRLPICGTEEAPAIQPGVRVGTMGYPTYSRALNRCTPEGQFFAAKYEGLRFGDYDDKPIYAVCCKPCESGTCDGVYDTLYEALGDEIPFTITDYDPNIFESSIDGYSGVLRQRDYWPDNLEDPLYPGCVPVDGSHAAYWLTSLPLEHIKSGFLAEGITPYVDLYAYVDCVTTESPLCVNVIFGVAMCALSFSSDNTCDPGVNCESTCDDDPYQWEISFSDSTMEGVPFLAFTATE